jgi:uncharacterized protein YegL
MLEVTGHRVILLIDRSGSMDTDDCEGQTRYTYLREKIKAFVPAAAAVAAGNNVTAIFFNHTTKVEHLSTADSVDISLRTNRPAGGTATHLAIEEAYKQHLIDPSIPTLVFLVTDGQPDSTDAVNKEIVSVTKRLSKPEDFRIMVLTVGERSPGLSKWLEQLDSELGPLGAKFDIVGQNNLNEVNFQEAAAELIGSTTTNSEAAAGKTEGKVTQRYD